MRLMHEHRRRHPEGSRRRRFRLADRQHRQRPDRPIPAAPSSRSSRATSASSTPRRSSTGCGRSLPKSRAPNLFLQPTQDINVGAPHRPRQLSVHVAGYQYRRAERVVAEAPGEAQDAAAARRRHQRPAGQRAEAADHHQSRPGVALRHFGAGDRRHAQRRVRPAPDHAIFHPAQNLFRGSGNPARTAKGPLDARPPLRQIAADRRRRAAVGARRRRQQRRRPAV